jgi:hypothetical protein
MQKRLNGFFDDVGNSISDGLAQLDPTAQLKELQNFLNSVEGQNLLKVAEVVQVALSVNNPVGVILTGINYLVVKPAFELASQQKLKQLNYKQIQNLYLVRKKQWEALQEYERQKQQLDIINAEIEKNKAQSDQAIKALQNQAQQVQAKNMQLGPETETQQTTEKTNYFALLSFLGLGAISGGSAYYFRKDKKGFYFSIFFFVLFVVLAFVFKNKKVKTETDNQELAGAGEWGSCTKDEYMQIFLNEGAYNATNKCNLPTPTGNFLTSYLPEGNFELPAGSILEIDTTQLQANLDNLNPFNPNNTPIVNYTCDDYAIKTEHKKLWAMIGIPLEDDILAKFVTYRCPLPLWIRALWTPPQGEGSSWENVELVDDFGQPITFY